MNDLGEWKSRPYSLNVPKNRLMFRRTVARDRNVICGQLRANSLSGNRDQPQLLLSNGLFPIWKCAVVDVQP
jgi:hypothetical protein